MKLRLMLVWCGAALAAFAQVTVMKHVTAGPEGQEAGMVSVAGGDVAFFKAETAGSSKVVKGAPYSAQTVTEHAQTLADGNTINQKQTGMVYRDSEGRTRREQVLGPIGPVPAGANPPQLVFINDPVAGVSYVLDVARKTAQKLPMGPGAGPVPHELGGNAVYLSGGPGPETHMQVRIKDDGPAPAQESLGSKVLEGVQADGTRITKTIPAGQIGNERPIQTVSERWFSPQLQVTVMSTTSDPMIGQTTYKLTNISLGEPSESLFEVPSDYTLNEGPGKVFYQKMITK